MPKMSFSGLSILCSRTDEEAMWRVKMHDDHREFARLVERWEQPIWRLCTRMTGDLHRGEDLKQEAFTRVFQKRQDYDPAGRFSTWLWRIALNVCYDDLRRRERHRELLRDNAETDFEVIIDESVSGAAGPDFKAAQLEEGELVKQALMQLPEIYRSVIVLRHYEDLKLAKIAEILEIPEGTVNSRMAEALSRLSRILEPKLRGQSRDPSVGEQIRKPVEVFLL